MTAYYNEFDEAAAAILRQLIADGVIAPGDVDTRSIKDVQPDDLAGYTQCHFFAGGGLWSVAARLAGFPDNRELWTGSCPCQPFSPAGKGGGVDDPRHLWPDFHRLIRAARPPLIMGEQVAAKAGYGWFDGVRADLANEDYACRAVDIPACSVDAPHQRNRLYWLAVEHPESERRREGRAEHEFRGWWPTPSRADAPGDVADGAGVGRQVSPARRQPAIPRVIGGVDQDVGDASSASAGRDAGAVSSAQGESQSERIEPRHQLDRRGLADDRDSLHADADRSGRSGWAEDAERSPVERAVAERHSLRNGSAWADAEWIVCYDGKARRSKPGIRLLVDGLPRRVDLWRVGGNAIVPALAAEVIAAFLDTEAEEASAVRA